LIRRYLEFREHPDVRPAQRLGERGTDEALIVVRRLLPAEDDIRLQLLDDAGERFRDVESSEIVGRGHERRVVAAHRERLSQRVARAGGSDRDDAYDRARVGVLALERELDRILVV